MTINKKKRVIVAMSGGVDSSVAAAVLQAQGFEVVGLFMHFWKEPGRDPKIENACCSLESLEDARRVGRTLGIPVYTANVEKEFKKVVVDYFIAEYAAGRTPNPCIQCNKEIKFKVLFRKMLELEADFVATGHYVRVKKSSVNSQRSTVFQLAQARDKEKDQSYFLYNLTQKELKQVLFPIGEFKNKDEVRAMAKKLKLPTHAKKDSQDVCFIPDSADNFLKRHIKLKPGRIVDENGNILGQHCGLALYTLGQRKGIKIGGTGPFFVVKKDAKKNELVVAKSIDIKSEILVEQVNWIQKPAKFPAKIWIKTRYRNKEVHGIIKKASNDDEYMIHNTKYIILLDKPERAITPGQSAVFYDRFGRVLGGGIISF